MRKRKVMIGLGITAGIGICIGAGVIRKPVTEKPQKVDPSEKVVLSDEIMLMASRLGEPSLELYAEIEKKGICDVSVVEGNIVAEEEWTHPLFEDVQGNDAEKQKYGGSGSSTEMYYTIELDRLWYGDIPESESGEIRAWIGGAKGKLITKPNVGDQVVLFLRTQNGRYTALDMEHGIFTVNDGTLYAFSNTENLSKYDGESVEVLMEDFYQELEEIGS